MFVEPDWFRDGRLEGTKQCDKVGAPSPDEGRLGTLRAVSLVPRFILPPNDINEFGNEKLDATSHRMSLERARQLYRVHRYYGRRSNSTSEHIVSGTGQSKRKSDQGGL